MEKWSIVRIFETSIVLIHYSNTPLLLYLIGDILSFLINIDYLNAYTQSGSRISDSAGEPGI